MVAKPCPGRAPNRIVFVPVCAGAAPFSDQAKNNRPKARSLQPWTKRPPVGCRSPGRCQSRVLHQQSHSTRIVAGVDILRHTSAHKGSPLFHRRAPATNTGDPMGLLAARCGTGRPAARRPTAIDGSTWINGTAPSAVCRRMAFSPRMSMTAPRGARTVAEGDMRWDIPRDAGAWPHRRMRTKWRRDSWASACPVMTTWKMHTACAMRRAAPPRSRSAAFPCSPGSGCMDRSRRSCRCAGAWARHTEDTAAMAPT